MKYAKFCRSIVTRIKVPENTDPSPKLSKGFCQRFPRGNIKKALPPSLNGGDFLRKVLLTILESKGFWSRLAR
jgi:hypothetical protein